MDGVRRYKIEDLDTVGRWEDPNKPRRDDSEIKAARKDAFDSLLNLILTHKKEIVKVPACSSYASAQEWASKRPGYRVDKKNIGGDEEEEVIVYNRSGLPVIVNGYKVAASDWGVRNAYYEAHPTVEHRAAAEPMKRWAAETFYKAEVDPTNPWRNKSVLPTKKAYNLKERGWKVPTRPKKQWSVYSIFSKNIAKYVKTFFESREILRISDGKGNLGPSSCMFLKKVVSQISVYRYLYMKLVERNYFFQLLKQKKITSRSYSAFKNYLKLHPNQFFTWFCDNFMDIPTQEFRESRVTQIIVGRNLANGALQIDGTDINDGLVFIIGLKNWHDAKPIFMYNNRAMSFFDIVNNNDVAEAFLKALSKTNPDRAERRVAAQALARFKKQSQEGTKEYFRDAVKQQFFNNEKAEKMWEMGAEFGCFTAGSEEAIAEHAAANGVQSPVKPIRDVPENLDQQAKLADEDDVMNDGSINEDEEEGPAEE